MMKKNWKSLRQEMNLSVRFVAKYLSLPIDEYLQIENGNKQPTLKEKQALNFLYGITEEKTEHQTSIEKMIQKLKKVVDK